MTSRILSVAVTLVLGVALAGCGGGESGQGGQQSTTSAGYEPVTIENCGIEQTFERPPERAVTMNQHATEIMLALGLEDRMVGTAFVDGEILPKFQEAYESVPVLAEEYPSKEALLGAEPDFVFAGFISAFESDAVGSREGLHELGIGTYLMTEYCSESEPASLDQVYQDIRNIGKIFGVEERAEELVGEMQRNVRQTQEAVKDVEKPLKVAYVDDSAEAAPFVAGGTGMVNEVIESAGAENAYPDLADQFAESSFEEFVRRDPEVILIGLLSGDTEKGVREGLLSNPALSEVEAVREERFVSMILSNLVAGVRIPGSIRYMAERLYPQQFEGEEYEPLYPGQFEGDGS